MRNSADLPNDIDALKALLLAAEQMVCECDVVIAAHDELVSGLRAHLTTTEVEIEHLKLMIAKLRRMQFGRKPEKLDHQIEQLELQLEDLQAAEGEAERERPPADKAPRTKRRANRCRSICRATNACVNRRPRLARHAVARYASWVRTSPSNWSSCHPASA